MTMVEFNLISQNDHGPWNGLLHYYILCITYIKVACDPIRTYYWSVSANQDHDVKDSDAETLSILIKLFAEKVVQWSRIIDALNCVDVLRSFAVTANSSRGSMCRPLVVPADSSSTFSFQETRGPLLMIKGLWHPYAVGENGGELVPNDVYLGKDTTGNCPRTLLLTGPNMGGKSTLLRATCLAVLLAQVWSILTNG